MAKKRRQGGQQAARRSPNRQNSGNQQAAQSASGGGAKPPRRGRRHPRSRVGLWLAIGAVCVVTALVIAFFAIQANLQKQQALSNTPVSGSTSTPGSTPTIGSLQQQLTSLSPDLLASAKEGPTSNTLKPVQNTPLLKDGSGKPIIFYAGAEFCPFCAAQRWPVIIALSRFGSFGPLEPIVSGEGQVPTFSFHNTTYTSQYVSLVAKETGNNVPPPSTGRLDTLTSEQQQLLDTYNKDGSIPFIDIANQFTSVGSYYQPETLVGNTHQQIVDQLKDPHSAIAKGVLGSANYLTAAICTTTNNQPANVCSAAPIPDMQKTLPKTAFAFPPAGPLALNVREPA